MTALTQPAAESFDHAAYVAQRHRRVDHAAAAADALLAQPEVVAFGLGPAQQKSVRGVAEMMAAEHAYGEPGEYEFKRLEIERWGRGTVSLMVEIGLKGDEGTAAEVFARSRVYVFIGLRGGVSAYGRNRKTRRTRRLRGWSYGTGIRAAVETH